MLNIIFKNDFFFTNNVNNYAQFFIKINDLVSFFYTHFEKYPKFLNILQSEINNTFNLHFIYILPEIFSLTTFFLLITYTIYFFEQGFNLSTKYQKTYEFALLSIVISNIILNFFTIYLYFFCLKYKNLFLLNNFLMLDYFTTSIKIFILFSSNIFLIFASLYWAVFTYPHSLKKYEYPFIFSLITLSIFLLVSSLDFIMLYLSLESLSFCLYILVVFKLKDKLAIEAGLKYFCLGSLASGFILFGISLFYSTSHSLNFLKLKYLIDFSEFFISFDLIYIYLGFVFILVGFLFKLGVFPYHMGLLDIYEGSSLIVTLYLISIVKFTILITLAKLLMNFFYNLQFIWSPLLSILSLSAMFFGSISALYQQRLKRFFAYSSIHQIGYILLSLSTGTFEGLHAALFYSVLYKISSISFLVIILLINIKVCYNNTNSKHKKSLIYFSDLIFCSKREPLLIILISIIIFSLANLPPFAGFFAKYLIFKSLLNTPYLYFIKFALLGIITSIISSFYYLRLFKLLAFNFKVENYLVKPKFFNNFSNFWYLNKFYFFYKPYLKKQPTQSYFALTCDLNLINNLHKLLKILISISEYFLIFISIFITLFLFFFNKFYIIFEFLSLSCLIPLSLYDYLFYTYFF